AVRERLALLAERAMLVAEVPIERVLDAVKDELVDITATARAEVARAAVQGGAARELWVRALSALDAGTCVFPRADVERLLADLPAALGELRACLESACRRHRDLERRVATLLRPLGPDELEALDPIADSAIIHH